MRKLLIFIIPAASTLLGGCGTVGEGAQKLVGITDTVAEALDRTSLIYRPVIQQGNVITQEQVDRLEPGMTREQVRFILGSPTLRDVFHDNRWDYPYTTGIGSRPTEIRHLAVFFENDRLVRIVGDYRPRPEDERPTEERVRVVEVPDWTGEEKTLLGRALDKVGLGDD